MGASSRMSTLFVGNLAWGSTSESLSAHLGAFGSVVSCDTGDVRNGRTRGWAIVAMSTADEANFVINSLNGAEFEGRPLNIRIDSKPEKAPGGGGGKGGGGGGGGDGGRRRGGDPALEGRQENSSGCQV